MVILFGLHLILDNLYAYIVLTVDFCCVLQNLPVPVYGQKIKKKIKRFNQFFNADLKKSKSVLFLPEINQTH